MTNSSTASTTTAHEPTDDELREKQRAAREKAGVQSVAGEIGEPPSARTEPAGAARGEAPTWDPPCVACGNPIGIEMPDGRYVGVTTCRICRDSAQAHRLVKAGIPRWFILADTTLDRFNDRQNTSLLRAKQACTALLKPMNLFDRMWFVISGDPGTGKSHLAAAVAQEFIRLNQSAQFRTFDEILVEVQDSYNETQDQQLATGDVIRRYTQPHFLAIDDLGVEAPTAHAIQILYRILNARVNDRRPTMITTNYPLTRKHEGRPTLGERLAEKLSDDTAVRRILDRIAGDAVYVHIDATSYRRNRT